MEILGFLTRKPFSIVGHRGAKGLAPENTLKSIRVALKLGVDAVEVDVRLSKDKKPILLHDEDFGRVSGVKLKPRDMLLEEIRSKIRVNEEPVPTLNEALELVSGKAGLLIEVKESDSTEIVLKVLEEYGWPKWVAIVSFHEEVLRTVRSINEEVVLGLIYAKSPGKIVEAKKLGAKIVLPHFRLASAKAVSFAHRLNLKVVAWTINDIRNLEKTISNGVDAVATDYPNLVVKFRSKGGTGLNKYL